jgi:hypothetical protein
MLPLTWCACYFPKIIILRFEVISEKIRKNPVNTEKTFSMYYTVTASAASTASAAHPVAAVMGMLRNPAAYMPSNVSSVIEGESDSDMSVSDKNLIATIANQVPSALTALIEDLAPFTVPHLFWRCSINGASGDFPTVLSALIDHGSHIVLISDEFANSLSLKRRKLLELMPVELAMLAEGPKRIVELSEWVKLKLYDPSGTWQSKTVHAIVAPSLCVPVILGGPFLAHNNIVIDHAARTAIDKLSGFDLLNPKPSPPPPQPKKKLKEFFRDLQEDRKLMLAELKMVCAKRKCKLKNLFEQPKPVDVLAAVHLQIEALTAKEQLDRLSEAVKLKHKDIFEPIPHLNKLPTDVYCRIQLKDASKTVSTRSYSTPRKYKEAWATLIQQHLDAGRIRPSNSAHASPAFLVPKADATVLPHWVNDYRALNANTVTDSHPLPRVDDILADCSKAKIWSVIDMTNSFFQTRVHPDDIHLTAVVRKISFHWDDSPF